MFLKYYLKELGIDDLPEFLIPYLSTPSLQRLKKIGYFCGMDYASKNIYSFREYISRYDHSLSVALLTYKLSKNKKATIAALFHDIATPCFSHVIDYMNEDYEKQESTEEYTEYILKKDSYFLKCIEKDNIKLEEVVNFKNYSIVDNDRPKLCADRLDGIILTSIGWTKSITKEDIKEILNDITVYSNEDNEQEIGFKSYDIASKVVQESDMINNYCHSNEDNYMMKLLAHMTKFAIDYKYITYKDLYFLTEEEVLKIFKDSNNSMLSTYLHIFFNIKKEDIPEIAIANLKSREINPLVNNQRYKNERKKHL